MANTNTFNSSVNNHHRIFIAAPGAFLISGIAARDIDDTRKIACRVVENPGVLTIDGAGKDAKADFPKLKIFITDPFRIYDGYRPLGRKTMKNEEKFDYTVTGNSKNAALQSANGKSFGARYFIGIGGTGSRVLRALVNLALNASTGILRRHHCAPAGACIDIDDKFSFFQGEISMKSEIFRLQALPFRDKMTPTNTESERAFLDKLKDILDKSKEISESFWKKYVQSVSWKMSELFPRRKFSIGFSTDHGLSVFLDRLLRGEEHWKVMPDFFMVRYLKALVARRFMIVRKRSKIGRLLNMAENNARERDIVRFQFEINSDLWSDMQRIQELGGLTTKKELINYALTMFRWAARQVLSGNSIAAVSPDGTVIGELHTPPLDSIALRGKSRLHLIASNVPQDEIIEEEKSKLTA